MIGINVRGARHLWRLSSTTPRTIFLTHNGAPYDICKIFKDNFDGRERVFIFGREFNNVRGTSSELSNKTFDTLLKCGQYRAIFELGKDSRTPFGDNIDIYMMPLSFDDDYEKFIKENSKMMKGFIERFGINESSREIKALYAYTNGSKNFFSWGVNLLFREGVSFDVIKDVMMWNDIYSQLTKQLKMGTITAYTSKRSIIPLLQELTELRMGKRINDSINSFNTNQKKLLKELKLTDRDKSALSMFAKLSDAKRLNFIKKMSTVDDVNELMRQMKFLVSTHFSWNKKSFIDYLSNVDKLNYKTIYDKDNIMVLQVNDFETVKRLAKSTNWCISKNKSYWNNYIENHSDDSKQYMIFDFSKDEDDRMSIIGFTVAHNKGITHAHDFTNNSLVGERLDTRGRLLKSYIINFINTSNIYDILKKDGIDISMVATYDKPQYEWNKDSFLKYLYSYVDSFSVNVLGGVGNKLALSVRDSNINEVFGESYEDNIQAECWGLQHVLFLDFDKSPYDPTKLIYAIIRHDSWGEDKPIGMYNELSVLMEDISFDEMLIDFKLPYNVIRRTLNPLKRLSDALLTYNVPLAKKILSEDKTLIDKAKEMISEDSFMELFNTSVLTYASFDYIDMFYSTNKSISTMCGRRVLRSLLKSLVSSLKITTVSVRGKNEMPTPSKELLEKFFSNSISTKEETLYVAYYLILKKIIDNEDFSLCEWKIYNDIFSSIKNYNVSGEIIDELLEKMIKNADFSNTSSLTISSICKSLDSMHNGSELKDAILSKPTVEKILTAAHKKMSNYGVENPYSYDARNISWSISTF